MILAKTIGSVVQRYQTDGHSPYLMLDEDLDKIILKPKNSINDTISLQKEYLCSLLLDCWNIKTPNVYLCNIDNDLYDKISTEDIRFRYSEFYFGCHFIENQFELNRLFSFSGKVPLRNFQNIESIIYIALFDIWIENDDRKPTNNNLLCSIDNNKFELYAIDHAFTFASLTFNSLSDEYLSFSDNDSILYSEVGISIVKSLNINEDWISHLKEYFYLCIDNVRQNINEIFNNIPEYFSILEQDRDTIKRYLFSELRIEEVFNTLLYIINDIRK
nr:HipA family kinase [uncultured Empedobacter sp.]